MQAKFPQLVIQTNKIKGNCSETLKTCAHAGVKVTGIIKGCNGLMPVVDALKEAGMDSFGSSRISHLANLAKHYPHSERWLVRIPMISELEAVVQHATVSLHSEQHTLMRLDALASRGASDRRHEVVLMIDLGDLREGVWGSDALVSLALFVENTCKGLSLKGVGTNLGCYGAIKPNQDNMRHLVRAAQAVEAALGRKLEVISGGATSTLPMVLAGELPREVNHLRIGEGILLSRDLKDFYGLGGLLENMSTDTFVLKAEIVEIQTKPSYPVGEIFVDAFGNKPEYEDWGMRKRAILAAGKQDFGDHSKLIPTVAGLKIIGSSSDHLIVDITDCPQQAYAVGDTMSFQLYYPAMLYLAIDRDVYKFYQA